MKRIMNKLETLLVAATFAQAGEFDTACSVRESGHEEKLSYTERVLPLQ